MTTQEERIIAHLKVFGTITNKQSNENYGYRHLPTIIRNIKKQTDLTIYYWWEAGFNRFGEKTRWKVYSLKPNAMEG